MFLIILFVLLSAYIRFKAVNAHINAGIQPIIVSCSTKQITPDKILPCNIKDSHGRKKAKTYLIISIIKVKNLLSDAEIGKNIAQ